MYRILHYHSYSTPQQPAEVQRDLEVFDVKVSLLLSTVILILLFVIVLISKWLVGSC